MIAAELFPTLFLEKRKLTAPDGKKKVVRLYGGKTYDEVKEYIATHRHVKEAPNVGGKPGTWKTVRY